LTISRSSAVLAALASAILQSAVANAEPQPPSALVCDTRKRQNERSLAIVVAPSGQSEVPVSNLFVAGRPEPGQTPKLCDPRRNNCSAPRALPIGGPPFEVLTATADWACIATYGRGVLWISSRYLKPVLPLVRPSLSDWLGHFVQGDDGYIDITSPDGLQLAIHGESKWHGLEDNVHFGEIQFLVVPTSNPLTLAGGGCEVTMTLMDGYLLLHDNDGCGGANVRFQWDWKRASRPH
jgi:hypothetical protein